jgi:hypothetical protein
MDSIPVVAKYPKIFMTSAILLAFAAGAVFEGYTRFGTTNASPATATTAMDPAPATPTTSSLVAQPHPYAAPAPRAVSTYTAAPVHHKRSAKNQALIIAGSSGAGAAIGAVAGGGKGAGIGALSGGAAGVIYDLATRNK